MRQNGKGGKGGGGLADENLAAPGRIDPLDVARDGIGGPERLARVGTGERVQADRGPRGAPGKGPEREEERTVVDSYDLVFRRTAP
jgi:hypothetical protein